MTDASAKATGDDREGTGATAERRAVRAWCLYDWANSAFATSVIAAILPVYFAEIAGRTMPRNQATAWWGYASSAAMLVAAFGGPLIGAAADAVGRRKPLLFACAAAGSLATVALAFVPGGDWRPLLALFAVAFVAFACGNVLYDSLLPAVAKAGELHRVSVRGFAYGYLGGGVLLAINLAWILMPQRFGLASVDQATRLSFASVGAWWLGFSIPLFRDVPEPGTPKARAKGLAFGAVQQVLRTIRHLPRHPDLFLFLIAFWLYSDGIGTIIKMATVYGAEVGIGRTDLIGALLMVQLLAAPASLAFGRLAKPLGPRRAVVLGLAGYTGITMLGFFMTTRFHFWALAALVAMFQGGTQALSRSMFAALVPPRQRSEMFGFFSVSEKMAGVVGPLVFGAVAQISGAGRWATLTLLPYFILGAWLLMKVDLERGAAHAEKSAEV